VILRRGALHQGVARYHSDPAIGDLDIETGIANTTARRRRRAFADTNPAAGDNGLRGAALDIVRDQLAAEQTVDHLQFGSPIYIDRIGETFWSGLPLFLNCELVILTVSSVLQHCKIPFD
jgi:hypothetical protein